MATVRLSRPRPLAFGRWPYTASNGVVVHVKVVDGVPADVTDQPLTLGTSPVIAWPREHEIARIGVAAVVPAGEPVIVDGQLEVPEEPRAKAEAAIGEFADVLAIVHQCKRVLRSPQPCVALRAQTPEEEAAVAAVRILRPRWNKLAQARVMPPVVPEHLASVFSDRLDGLALLADSLAEDNAVGRSRELFRLFERAFRRGPGECVQPLTAFLRSHPNASTLGYEKSEVSHWLEKLRAEAVHADRRPSYARSPDLEPFLPRMEFAGYDVLFNKSRWRDPSSRRTDRQQFISGVSSDRESAVLFHPGATLMVDWIDHWGVHPIDFDARMDGLDEAWIWRLPGEELQESSA
jgi:hypothetical protein